jgi:hypothetical protein
VKQQGKGKRKVWRMGRKEKDKKIQGEGGRVVTYNRGQKERGLRRG